MALAGTAKVVLGSIAFAIFWVLAVFPVVPFLPIGRTAGSLLGAMLMVIFRVITPDEAYDAIDLPILGLLFGTMVVGVYLEKADMFKYLAKQNLPPHPFLLALASSANIGSSATPIGNPQNLVIAVQSKISFGNFLFGILPAMLLGVLVNALILLCMYWKLLSVHVKDEEHGAIEKDVESINIGSSPNINGNADYVEVSANRSSSSENEIHKVPSELESGRNSNASKEMTGDGFSQRKEETVSSRKVLSMNELISSKEDEGRRRWKRLSWKTCVYLVVIGMLISLLLGLNMSWTAITAALVLVVLDFKDAQPCLEKVSYSLLIFFCGLFITVLTAVILILSNLVSNVPTVLLLGGPVAASAAAISAADEKKAWLILAWVSTVAGNLSLLGSAANLIVCEQARRAPNLGYTLTFWNHLKFGFPSTLIITAIGLPLIKG
ncbi:hypothetical protein F0562_031221 [Nyssa sinensis]|uniref:Citrate transporter-like domain-containing protein n=1 Tax=Nyssa sinensis TaxID=561372 RepID=A0A5J5ATW2_9ASTE|nr:hypothetical protein F0562_031221 [Nyssa sinensis]